ncbi:hypothetical protein N1851_024970 [Merluccius polli]|uniref:Uncharacterized protein n=1 Tax=Merluccius polli TaxID=89951 RepID=A0AA47MDZ1_MERPO|nr:hypothetical protein N1851_024970 [Merluccius polli]
MLQSRVNHDSPTTSRVLRNSGRTSSTPGALPPRSFLTTSATSAPEIGEPTPESPGHASLPEGVSVGLRRSSKYSFHRTSRVEVSSAPSPPYIVLTMHCFPLLRRWMVVQNLFEAVQKSFSMASPNSSMSGFLPQRPPQLRSAWPAGTCLLPPESHRPKSLTASLTAGVHQRVRELPPLQAPTTLRPQLRSAALTMEARNMAHSDSMSPASPGTWSKLSRRWELKLSLTGDSARCSQQTLTMCLGLPGLTGILPHHRSQLTTRW